MGDWKKNQLLKKVNRQKSGDAPAATVPVEKLVDNPFQTRLEYDQKELEDLAQTIKKEGLLQPIVVTPKDDHFIIVVGHRRKRAFELLGEKEIPAIIKKSLDDKDLQVLVAIENLQRVNLNVIEEGKMFADLLAAGFTQDELSARLGIDATTIGRKKNLLKLNDFILDDLRANNSTNDVKALSIIRGFKDKDIQNTLYNGLLLFGRDWVIDESKNKKKANKPEHAQVSSQIYTIKGKKLTIDLSSLSDEQVEKLKKAVEKLGTQNG